MNNTASCLKSRAHFFQKIFVFTAAVVLLGFVIIQGISAAVTPQAPTIGGTSDGFVDINYTFGFNTIDNEVSPESNGTYLVNLKQIAVGTNHTCTISNTGSVYCWGFTGYGQVGDDQIVDRKTPVRVLKGAATGADTDGTYLINIKSITAGYDNTCAVSNAGNMYCWGASLQGQLGDGQTSTNRLTPVRVLKGAATGADTDGTYLINVASSTASDRETCAISNSGATYCWGYAYVGRLGDGQSSTNRLTPVRVLKGAATGADTDGTYLINMKNIVAGEMSVCAVSNTGAMYCWGSATNGRLGNNVTSGTYATPVRVLKGAATGADTDGTNLINIKSIVVGYSHTCAISNSGATYCWGSGANGRLGNNVTSGTYATPVRVLKGAATGADTDGTNLINMRSIADAGFYHTCAVSNTGAVYCWGAARYGELGDNQSTTDRKVPVRVLKGAATGADTDGTYLINIKTINEGDTGQYHNCAISNSGVTYCWGAGANGRLGDNQTTDRFTPVRPEDGAAGPVADQVRFGIDWDMNGSVDQWVPSSGYVTAGTAQQVVNNWSSAGVKNFQVLAEDDEGARSGWTSHTITITDPNTPPSIPTVSGTTTIFTGINYEYGFKATDTASTVTTSVDQALAYSAPEEAFAGFGQWSNVRYRGMGFTPSQSNVAAISFDIDQLGTKGLKIYIDSANANSIPDHTPENALYSWVVPNSEVHYGSAPYYLPAPLTVTPGNQYVMYYAPWDTSSNTYADDYRDMTWRNNNAYAGGKPVRNDNGVWSVSDSGNLDQVFGVYASVTTTVNDQIRYGVDWDMDGIVNDWVPSSGYVPSGTWASTTHMWDSVGSGSYTFQARTQDDGGKFSDDWTSFMVTVGNRLPSAQIDNPPAGSQSSPVYPRGSFFDSDGDSFDAYEWYEGTCGVGGTLLQSVSGGPFSSPTPSFEQVLSNGPHSLFFRVKDDRSGSEWSVCAQQDITISPAGVQCSDGSDNDDADVWFDDGDPGSGENIASADPSCYDYASTSPAFDPNNPSAWYIGTRNESANPQCSDGVDNNNDGFYDLTAPACYDNHNPSTGVYNKFFNSENTCNVKNPMTNKKECEAGYETFGSCPIDCADQFKYIEI